MHTYKDNIGDRRKEKIRNTPAMQTNPTGYAAKRKDMQDKR
jgi:hypothetical protein